MIINEEKLLHISNKITSLLSQFKTINIMKLHLLPIQIAKMDIGANKISVWLNKTITEITEDDLSGVTTIGDSAFYVCESLTSVTIPDSVTTIGNYAFGYCKSLASVTIPDSVISIGDLAFYGCDNLTSVTVDVDNISYSSDSTGALFDKNKTVLIQYPIGNTNSSYTIPDSVTTIGDSAFESCDSLTSITIPDRVTTIGEYAFYDCDSLTSVTIPDGVTSIAYATFANCDNLTSVTLGASVTRIAEVSFQSCSRLTDIYLKPTIPPYLRAASGIPSTTTIHVPVGSGDAYKSATNWSYYSDRIVEDIVIE